MESQKIIINIGRQFGSGGRMVAELIGKKLGVKVFDNNLLIEAAERSGLSPEFFRSRDEHKSFFSLGYSQNSINDESLFKIQSDTIRIIAERESAVFVGRAADYVLRDKRCLDVFLSAPMDFRVKLVSERSGIMPKNAERLIQQKDKARETWYNYFTFGHWGMASNYDLCMDTSILGLEGTADYIIDFIERGKLF